MSLILVAVQSEISCLPAAKMPPAQPELKKYLDKRLYIQLNGSRRIIGILRGYDVYLNIVLDNAIEETPRADTKTLYQEGTPEGEKKRMHNAVIRGNSVVMLEALERIGDDPRDRRG